ncbi:methyl-accepting chemotaxis protein [Geobacillus proteiniphilus]|uniref:Methyl-accepting chemotaxis protein n=3 Tax=Geobacillus TaxID=129337 RepID=A0ABY9MIW9_9BACL|nr:MULTISPECIES: methyl-accepting chemotaxis protein [Geobacillus]MED3667710.1 methyl-accepting chemotaxis protein [Geobacillus kaustophilus]WMJ17786.1 methyl-accepting chemotaxis protein [Geobacillus proteiniphilus]
MKSFKLGTKMNVMFSCTIVLLTTVIMTVASIQIKEGIKKETLERVKSNLILAYRYIDEKYKGNWMLKDGMIYKGETQINGDNQLVDEIGKMIGGTVTIFQNDTRVATNIILHGQRAIGTTAPKPVVNKVLKEGGTFFREVEILGEWYQAAYMPIKSHNGEIIGMFYVGIPQKHVNTVVSSLFRMLLLSAVAVLAIAASVTVWFTRHIRVRLDAVSKALQQAGEGDFTVTLNDGARDEIGQIVESYNKMRDNLSELLARVTAASEQVAAAAEELTASAEQTVLSTEQVSAGIQEVANRADIQSSKTDATAASMEQMAKGVASIVDRSTAIADLSVHMIAQAEDGGKSVEKTVEQMNAIQQSVLQSEKVIRSLQERSKEIESIVNIINQIAEQTNLLALNAAIEAARAGEHGAGFAVVADEVRKLAEQSQESTKQIAHLIARIQQDIENTAQIMGDVIQNVQSGMNTSQETSQKFHVILKNTKTISAQLEDVSASVQQLSAGIQELDSTITELAATAEKTMETSKEMAASAEEQVASMEEITSSAQSLANLSETLQEIAQTFHIVPKEASRFKQS